MGEYVLKSIKAIEFYNKNPHFDFNNMNLGDCFFY